jgi:hypothetical protein
VPSSQIARGHIAVTDSDTWSWYEPAIQVKRFRGWSAAIGSSFASARGKRPVKIAGKALSVSDDVAVAFLNHHASSASAANDE